MLFKTAFLLTLTPLASAWLPGIEKDVFASDGTNLFQSKISSGRNQERFLSSSNKIRGVNLGSMFVFEPWIASGLWNAMCGNTKAESECTASLGQADANTAFQNHWKTWIVQGDFTNMTQAGLNTVRIPVGFWMDESLVFANETFPQGGMQYLQQVCEWAAEAGIYVIIDLHGAPGGSCDFFIFYVFI